MKKLIKTFGMGINKARAILTMAQKAMPSIYEALIELITNCDAAYAAMHGKETGYKGSVRIEYERGGKKNPTILRVMDRASGMSWDDIQKKLLRYFEDVSTTERSLFGSGFKNCVALGDIIVKSAKKNDEGKILYTEIFISRTLDDKKNKIVYQYSKFNRDTLKRFGTKKPRTGTVIEISIEPGNARYNTQAPYLIENLPHHYALSDLINISSGTLDITFVDINNKKDHKISFTPPNAQLVANDEKVFPGGEKATFKLWRFDELLEEETMSNKFTQLGISIFSSKACHEKTFLNKKIENDELRKRYFGELRCPDLTDKIKEYMHRSEHSIPFDPDNDTWLIEDTRLSGINREHKFIKQHLYPWASNILKSHIDADRKKEIAEKGIKDEYIEKTLKDAFKELSKELDIQEDEGTDTQELGITQWLVIPKGRNLTIGEKVNIRISTRLMNLKSGIDTVEFKSDKPYDFVKVDKDIKKLTPIEVRPDVVRASFEVLALKEGEQNFKIFHGSQLKTEFKIRVQNYQDRLFNNLLEFEHKDYTVTHNKNRNLKLYARVPDLVTDESKDNQIRVSIADNSVVKLKSPCSMKIVEGTNYAVGNIKLQGLQLNGKTIIQASFNDTYTKTSILVTDTDQKGIAYEPDIGPHNLGNKRAVWDPENPNILKISTKHPVIKKFLGSEEAPYPNSKSPAWKTMMWEILCEKFAEKKVQLVSRKDPEQYGDLTNGNDTEAVIKQTQVYIENEKTKFINKFLISKFNSSEVEFKSDG